MRNVVADDHARHARRGVQVDLDSLENKLSVAPRQFYARQVYELDDAMATLPAQQRDVLRLVGVEGFSYEDVAERLNIPIGTVMSRLHRARDALRVRFSGALDVPGDLPGPHSAAPSRPS